ncbi:GerMN domain-containing protein [Candidatus Wolfebacteria bacterium]|nr:GerMN domain-containing protein [Candidatus Wolfebacteria bacterium]
MGKTFLLVSMGIILAGSLIYIYLQSPLWQYILDPRVSSSSDTKEINVKGEILDIALGAKVILLKKENGEEISLALTPETKLFDETGHQTDLNFLERGFEIEAKGEVKDNSDVLVREIKVIKAPKIIVISPKANESVSEIFEISGKVRVFNGSTPPTTNARIIAGDKKIYENGIIVNTSGTEQSASESNWYIDFTKKISFDSSLVEKGSDITLEIGDGVIIPLKYDSKNNVWVNVYFGNTKMGSSVSCERVFSVTRTIPKTLLVGRLALEELLKGPTDEEKNQGYFTNINQGVGVKSLIIDNGVAKADFDDSLARDTSGSCRIAWIRAQIKETLKQFPGVREVVISINGNSTSTLQP